MNCLKCGRTIEDDQVFCLDCLKVAQKYPIDANAVYFLPRKEPKSAPRKQPRRRTIPPELRVRILRRQVITLWIWLAVSIMIIGALSVPTYLFFTHQHYAPGQNYTSVASTSPSTKPVEVIVPTE